MNANQLVQHAGVSYRQLDYWVRCDYVRPVGEPEPGTGRSREFTYVQVQRCAWMARLVKVGFTPEAAAGLVRDGEARKAALAALSDGWLEESA